MLACRTCLRPGVPAAHLRATLVPPHLQQQHQGRMAAEGTAKMAAAAGEQDTAATSPEDPIVQYIVLRKDLWTEQGWPLGPLIAQACHASVAAVMEHRDDEATQRYCAPENIDQMTKVRVDGHVGIRSWKHSCDHAQRYVVKFHCKWLYG
eukprot:363790-Chlamydomonas_euryale.AAC.20